MPAMLTRSLLLATALTLAASVATAQDEAAQVPQAPPVASEEIAAQDDAAQDDADQVPPEPPEPIAPPPAPSQGPVFRFGGDYSVMADERVREVVVVAGSATIDGRVDRDVVVILGMVQLGATADVRGSLVVVGGSATVADGAAVNRDVVVVGGGLDGPAGFSAGAQQTVIGPIVVGDSLWAAVPWFTRGALWGRPIVPDLPWVWAVVAVFALLYLALGVVFDRPVAACTELLRRKPLTTFLTGLLVLLLIGPVSFVLAVSIVGLAVEPLLLCAVLVAAMVGKAGVARWIGSSALPEGDPDSRLQVARSIAIGLAAITLLYLVPVLGLVAWTMLGVFGLGAASTAFVRGLRRENPAPPTPAVPPPAPPVGATQPGDGTADDSEPPAEPGTTDLTAFPRALFLQRLGAFALDIVLAIIVTALFELDEPGQFFALLIAYHVVFWGWKGTTVGGIITQLRVVRTDGQPLRFADALVRGLASIFSVAVFGLGCFWILRDSERQSWHDKIAGTYVVRVPKNWPLP